MVAIQAWACSPFENTATTTARTLVDSSINSTRTNDSARSCAKFLGLRQTSYDFARPSTQAAAVEASTYDTATTAGQYVVPHACRDIRYLSYRFPKHQET